MAGINPFGPPPEIVYNPQDMTYRGQGGIIIAEDVARAQLESLMMDRHRNAAAWMRARDVRVKRALYERWESRMLRLEQKALERRLRPVYKALWFFGYLWGGMTLVAATAWLFKFTIYSTLS